MTVLNQGKRAGSFILSEANGRRSRANVTVLAGGTLTAGMVYALDGASKAVPLPNDGSVQADGIAIHDVTAPATADALVAGFVRDGEVIADQLTWPEGISQANQDAAIADLVAKGIQVRTGETAFTP